MSQAIEPLHSYHSGAWLRLVNLLQNNSGFQLIVLEYSDSVYRQQIIEQLTEKFPPQVLCDASQFDDYFAFEAQVIEAAHQQFAVHWLGLERWLFDRSDFQWLHALNHHREHLARQLPIPIFVWLLARDTPQFAHQTADLWAWRSGVLDFCLRGETVLPVYEHRLDLGQAFSQQQADRLAEIEVYLKNRNHQQALDADLLNEQADILHRQGHLDLALDVLQSSIQIARQHQDRLREASARGKIADILYDRGQLDEALRIRQQEELPVYEQMGDIRGKVLAVGKIADILKAHGKLDQALSIRQQEQLPLYEQLGDVRGKAVTMGKIADILQDRGQLDEALRIYQLDELPVYEQLGDVRGKAVAMGKIADILHDRGQLDEAMQIRQQTELPVYEQLGDMRSKAVTIGKIADIFQARGQLDEALRIHQLAELPVYEQLGDLRGKAIAMSKISDILHDRGQLDEALRILRQEVLPSLEQLGDVHSLLVGRTNLALLLHQIDPIANAEQVHKLLLTSLQDAHRLHIPEAQQIEGLLRQLGWTDDEPAPTR